MCESDSVCDLLAELERQEEQAIKNATDMEEGEDWHVEYIDSFPEASLLELS